MKISRLRFNHSNGLPFPDGINRLQGCALTIGNFDGLHRGHQIMLAHLKEKAKQLGLKTAVLTFEPHPRDFFAKQKSGKQFADTFWETLPPAVRQVGEPIGAIKIRTHRFPLRVCFSFVP